MHRVLFFDLDNTLFDRDTLVVACSRIVLAQSQPELQRTHEAVIGALIEQLYTIRDCRDLTRWLQQRCPGRITFDQVEATYTALIERLTPAAAVISLFNDLAACCRLALLTNGSQARQRLKIDRLGLASYFEAVLISGELGMAKPELRIFLHAQEQMHCAPDACVMIGDDLTNDIAGAARAGWTTCWFATKPSSAHPHPEPYITIRQLEDCRRIFLS